MTGSSNECPECHESIGNRDAKKHAIRHWGFEPVLGKTISQNGLERAKKLDSNFRVKGGNK